MKSLWILGLLLAVPAAAQLPEAPPSIEDLAWMAGAWSAEGDGVTSEEHWTAPAGGLMLGMHRDVRPDGTFFEHLRIEAGDDGIAYVASPQGGPSTTFPLTEAGPGRAVFENPAHDFPQRIVYTREGDTLCAGIAAAGKEPEPRHVWCWQRGSL